MASASTSEPASKRAYAGFFSSASSFSLAVGRHVEPGAVRGYYIDMSVKAMSTTWPPPGTRDVGPRLHVAEIQWALGCWERYLSGDGEQWLRCALDHADELVRCQLREGAQAGGFVHDEPFRHTFPLTAPWLSSMAQGEGASLLARAYAETGDERYAEAARRALAPLAVDVAQGGVRAQLDGRPFPEEYPTQPPSFVLNGAIFTIWGIYDVAVALGDAGVRAEFESAVDTLADNLCRWDLGYWSRYDLFPHPVVNVASSFYHDLHVKQLRVLNRLSPRPQLAATADRWARAATDRACRSRAFARKALFRLLVPRNAALAHRLPWSRLRDA